MPTKGAEESMERCIEKARMSKAELAIATNSERVEEAVKEIGNGRIRCIRADSDSLRIDAGNTIQKTAEKA